jgi:multimeric flavodoxin WrbA
MRIVAFNGSPHAAKGNTHVMVREFLAGAEEGGAETEIVFLAEKEIKHCIGCFACWVKTPGVCIHKDDMAELLEKYTSADVIVFATPLYVDNVGGIMKNFMDRLVPLADPHFEKDENGETRHVKKPGESPKLVVISNCGYPEQSHFQVLRLLFQRIARNFHSEVIGEIYRGAGAVLTSPRADLKMLVSGYKRLLRNAGRELVEDGHLSDVTTNALEKQLIPTDIYIAAGNKMWDEELAKLKE